MNDLKFASRQLLKNPGFTAVAMLTLALGIGGSTAIYSVVNTVILNPVPGPEPDRLIQIGERSHGNKDEPRFGGVTAATIEILKTKPEFFSDVVWFTSRLHMLYLVIFAGVGLSLSALRCVMNKTNVEHPTSTLRSIQDRSKLPRQFDIVFKKHISSGAPGVTFGKRIRLNAA